MATVAHGNNPNNRPPRQPLTKAQVDELERVFDKYRYLALPDRAALARKTGLTHRQIQSWFQRRRRIDGRLSRVYNLAGMGLAPVAPPPQPLVPTPAPAKFKFTQAQVDELERFFDTSHYPDIFSRERLAMKTVLAERQVQTWFERRRRIYRQASRLPRVNNLAGMGQAALAPPPQPPVLTPAPPPAPRQADRDTEDQISRFVDNLDDQIVQLKQQLKDEQDSRKTVEAELEMARRENETLKNNNGRRSRMSNPNNVMIASRRSQRIRNAQNPGGPMLVATRTTRKRIS